MKMDARLVFAPSVEGLLVRGIGAELTPQLRAELRELGIDLDRPLLPGYPAEVWHEVLRHVAARLYPSLTLAQAYFKMGERTVYGLGDTLLGKAMISVARLIGPRRMLLRLPINVKSGSNFAHLTVTEVTPSEFTVVSQPYMGLPEFMQASVLAAITIAGAVEPSVEVIGFDDSTEKLTLRASWRGSADSGR